MSTNAVLAKPKTKKHAKNHPKNKSKNKRSRFFLISLSRSLKQVHGITLESLSLDQIKFMRNHVREFMGTQQPIITVRTGLTTLTTTGTNLTQVVAMDVTGIAAWSSFAAIFDEYRVKRAVLHVVQNYSGYGASATTLAAMPVIVVIDYDDATALGSSTNALQYDTLKIIHLGTSKPGQHKSKPALPEGQPDLAWVTTSSPSIPFWWKFWSITTLVPATAAVGACWIECEIEFRQVA